MVRERRLFTEGYRKMELKAVSGIMLTLLLIGILALAFNIQPVEAEPRTWTVDDDGPADFHTIQEAINVANEGDTIFVKAGTYYEHIVINKPLSLIGENRSTTIIDGNGLLEIVNIVAHDVFLSGFTVRNGYRTIVVASQITLSRYNTIHGCVLRQASFGIILWGEIYADASGHSYMPSELNVIEENIIETTYAIELDDSHNNKIADNIIENGAYGIYVDGYSHDNLITGNLLQNIRARGEAITLMGRNATIIGNTFKANDWGLFIYGDMPLTHHIYHNNFIANVRHVELLYGPSIVWDSGYPSGGNYWSDYTDLDQYSGPYQNETGSDGIWDNPYFIDENNRDNYPLIHLYGSIRNLDTNLTYLTIQSAIDAHETLDGQTILVDAGTYYEHVNINKSISLIGESKATTIINGNGTTNAIFITTNEVEVSGFTITNGGSSSLDSGIYVNGSASKIHDNLVTSNSRIGIFLSSSNNNTLSSNTISNNEVGIYLNNSDFNGVRNNSVMNNENGIWLLFSSRNTFAYNNISDNNFNLGIDGNSLLHFVNDIDTSNKVNGKPVYYLINQSNILLDNLVLPEIGYMGLVNCANITLRGLDVTNNCQGVMLAYTCDSTIESVKASDNGCGIYLWSSNNNTIIDDTISNNLVGIQLSHSSGNSIRASGILENGFYAILLEKARRNNIVGNTISNNDVSIFIVDSNYTVFYHNNFINKTIPMSSLGSNLVILDNGAEGNYWSDYNGIDSNQDGIGDSPYSEPGIGSDLHPLMGIFSDFKATSEHHVQTICNSSISDFQFNGTAISFNVSGENDTPGFCRIRIPTALMNGTYKVFVNGTEVSYALLPCSNTTHSYLYFTYDHSTQEVWIVPEFPTWTSMLLILIVLAVAITIYKRKLPKKHRYTQPSSQNGSSNPSKT